MNAGRRRGGADQDKQEVDVQTEAQEKAFEQIDGALEAIKRMGQVRPLFCLLLLSVTAL